MDIPSIDEYIEDCLSSPISPTNSIENLEVFYEALNRHEAEHGNGGTMKHHWRFIDADNIPIDRHDPITGEYIDTVSLSQLADEVDKKRLDDEQS